MVEVNLSIVKTDYEIVFKSLKKISRKPKENQDPNENLCY